MSKVVQLLKSILPFVSLLMFALVVYFIHTFLETHSFLSIKNELDSISGKQLFLAIATTVLAYTVLAFYDVLAFRYVNEKLSLGKILFGSFSAFAFSNSIGLANLAGSSIRLRIYTSYGVTFNKIAQVIAFVTMSFWLGFFALSGFVFIFVGLNIPPEYVVSPLIIRWIGVIFLIIVFTYLFYSAYSKQHLKIKSIQIELPNFKLSLAQIVVASTDWCLAGLTLYLLLPESTGLTFPVFLSIFLSAQVIALLTHIPGGLGILEGIVIYFVVPNHHATPAVVAALLLYRLLYYIAPLLLAGSGLVFYELYLRRQKVSSMAMGATAWVKPLAPICFSIFSFVSGATLLISGSTPNIQSRSEWLANMFPLSLLEISHFLGSCFGVVLIALSVSLFNRNRAAWLATLCSLWAGALLSILKGLDYEEAIILSLFSVLLFFSKEEFYRPSRLFQERWSKRWFFSAAVIILGSIWLGFFVNSHVNYSPDLWWDLSLDTHAPRFLRAFVGICVTSISLVTYHLLSPPQLPPQKVEVDPNCIKDILARSESTLSQLVLLGDKEIFVGRNKKSFLMYGVQGQHWIVLGDPVGDFEEFDDLLYDFKLFADQYQAQVAFYQIRPEFIPFYIDFGFIFLKLGEEAFVPLSEFSLEGRSSKGLRQSFNRIKKLNINFKIYEKEEWPKISQQIKKISDLWLENKNTAEKKFSIGCFDEKYLENFATAVLEQQGNIVAFTNVWKGANKKELSMDLMRFDPHAVNGLMEHLIVELMLWGKENGFHYFNLGMAPLSGLKSGGRFGSRWNKVGELTYNHAERFYNFRGLRQYKEKFNPTWESRYLAYSSKVRLPLLLKDLAIIISGGIKRMITK